MIFPKEKVVDDIQASSTGTIFEQSASGRKNNPDMLQEYEEQEVEEANSYAGVNAEANKIDEENNDMIISMEGEQKTLEYQETIKLDVENIVKNKNKWRPIYEVIDTSFFAETKTFPPEFLCQCIK